MQRDHSFENQLKNLENEAGAIASYVYAEMAIQHAASQSDRLLKQLNQTPRFWLTCNAAFQSAAYIGLGRVFDLRSPYNLEALLVSMERDLSAFGRDALAQRKRAAANDREPSWLNDYLDRSHYPTSADVARLRKNVARYRLIYDRVVMPVRHQYLAHRQAHGHARVQKLFQQGKIRELWQLATFLLRLHSALWNMLENGRKPVLRPVRFSARQMYATDDNRSGPHEQIVREIRSLMESLERLQKPSAAGASGKSRKRPSAQT